MAQSKITLIGFYNYMQSAGMDLFQYMTFPAGIDKDTVINTILLNGGEFEVLYSDPTFMQNMIQVWSNKYQWTFERWIRALNEEYNPLHNFDRHEVYKDIRNIKEKESSKGNIKSNATVGATSSGTSEDQVSAYNESTYQPKEKTISSDSATNTSNNSTDSTGSNDRTTDDTLDHDAHLYGNIGVTTSQQMLKDELDIATWNVYNHIADLFIGEFCIWLY